MRSGIRIHTNPRWIQVFSFQVYELSWLAAQDVENIKIRDFYWIIVVCSLQSYVAKTLQETLAK